ncbi:MAG: serine/threonine-protein kinase [Planctomycetota bacterium]
MSSPPPDIPGLTLARPIGRGGQGSVYEACDADGERYAVKYLPFGGSDTQAARDRFEREARLLRDLHHPNLVAVRAYGFTPGGCYLVMELLEGQSLSEHLTDAPSNASGRPDDPTILLDRDRPDSPLPRSRPAAPARLRQADHWRWIARVGIDLCAGIARLHAAGVMHRDIKPANVVIEDGGRVVLVDLSLVAAADLPPDPSGAGGGTHGYMSPEQRRGRPVTPRSDIYSLGCTLYACLVGCPPNTDGMSGSEHRAILREANPAPSDALVAAIGRCLEPEPLDRYPSVDHLRAELEAVVGRRHRPRARVLWYAALLALVAVAGLAMWQRPSEMREARALVDQGDAGALRRWLDEHQAAGRDVLEKILAACSPPDHRALTTIATALGWGVLHIAASPHWRAHVCAHPDPEPDPRSPETRPPAASEYASLGDGATFVARPGFATIRLLSTRTDMCWRDHPLVFRLLRRVDAYHSTVEVDPEMLPGLGDIQPATLVQWYDLPPGAHGYEVVEGVVAIKGTFDLPKGLAIATTEAGQSCVRMYQEFVRKNPERRAVFAHPLEPKGSVDAELDTIAFGDRDAPAVVSYWMAFRVATFLAARLPTAREWSAVARHCYADAEPSLDAWLEAQARDNGRLVDVGAPDAFPGLGVRHLLDNAREWVGTLAVKDGGARSGWAPCGTLVTGRGLFRTGPVTAVTLSDQQSLSQQRALSAGFRLVRDLPVP